MKRVSEKISGLISESNDKKQYIEKSTSKVKSNNTIVPITDLFSYVVDCLTYEDRLTLRSINKETEKLITTRLFFNELTVKLKANKQVKKQKLDFVIAKNLGINIKINHIAESIQALIDFLSSANAEKLKSVNKILIDSACSFSFNIAQIQELLNLISNNNDNLINLNSINIRKIDANDRKLDQINIPNSLPTNLVCLIIANTLRITLNLPDTLPSKLKTLSLGCIQDSIIQFQPSLSAPALERIDFATITDESIVNCPDIITASALKSISFFNIAQSTIKCPSKIENTKPFINFITVSSRGNPQINIPETLLKDISALTYDNVRNTAIEEQLKNCQVEFNKLQTNIQ